MANLSPPQLPRGKVFVGARARLTVGSHIVGFATGCSGGEAIQYEELAVLDNIEVQEHVATAYTVSFSAERVRIVDWSVKSSTVKIFPPSGKTPYEHLENILSDPYQSMSAVIEDTHSNQVIMLIERVKLANYNVDIGAREMASERLDFVGIRMRDESELAD